jgi:CBS domain-containing protein
MHLGEQFRGNVVTVEPDDTIVAAMWKMRDRNVGAVVVVEGKQVKGVVTDRDIAIRLCGGEAAPESSVSRIMSQPPITIREDQGVFNATRLMAEHQIRRLPVVNKKDELVGIVSFDDMLALCASELTNLSKVVEPTLIAQA